MAAPVYRLPSELLSQAFMILTQEWLYYHSIGDSSDGRTNYPIMLSSVCVRWRQVAINTSSLWSHLYFTPSLYTSNGLQLASIYLLRSSNLPLDVYVGRCGPESTLETIGEQRASLLDSCAMRLKTFALTYMETTSSEAMLSTLLRGAAGRIQKLALYAPLVNTGIFASPSLPQEILDRVLQPLHSLYLQGVTLNWNTIACRNLVELQIIRLPQREYPNTLQFIEFLNANPAIRKLKLTFMSLFLPPEAKLPPITLPALQDLELDLNTPSMRCFIKSLAPMPQPLSLKIRSYDDALFHIDVVNFFCSFFQQTRVVSLCIVGQLWLPLSGVFAHLPHLQSLRIHEARLPDLGLADAHQRIDLLPKLHTVELVECTTDAVETGLWTILSLPSVKIVLFTGFMMEDGPDWVKMSEPQVREWMHGLGVTVRDCDYALSRVPRRPVQCLSRRLSHCPKHINA
ncbi:hypothetical protein BDV93DRAFT_604705 [Ceratobasidium sp. AG-I]|nr:hypothetical protein BDV93DRAFT_604705 [Ceratobasidium sp. AG-I]